MRVKITKDQKFVAESSRWPFRCYRDHYTSATGVRPYSADQEAVMYGQPGQGPSPQDFRHAEQAARERYESLEGTAARRAQLDIQRPKLGASIRHLYCWLTRRKPAEH
jgi:hypothetical protein